MDKSKSGPAKSISQSPATVAIVRGWLSCVAGDDAYGSGRDKTVPDHEVRSAIASLGRQFLHAEQLGFCHPKTKEQLRFTAPLPSELESVLNQINSRV